MRVLPNPAEQPHSGRLPDYRESHILRYHPYPYYLRALYRRRRTVQLDWDFIAGGVSPYILRCMLD